jgi:hypothetical protein
VPELGVLLGQLQPLRRGRRGRDRHRGRGLVRAAAAALVARGPGHGLVAEECERPEPPADAAVRGSPEVVGSAGAAPVGVVVMELLPQGARGALGHGEGQPQLRHLLPQGVRLLLQPGGKAVNGAHVCTGRGGGGRGRRCHGPTAAAAVAAAASLRRGALSGGSGGDLLRQEARLALFLRQSGGDLGLDQGQL